MNLQQKKDNSFLATEPLGKLLLKLSLPTVTAQIINMLYNIVDRIYIGHIPENGALALTGVGVCMPLIMIVSAFAALVGNGGAPRASIFMGKGDKESAERTLGNCFTTQIIVSLLLTIILFTGNRSFLMAFGASENTIPYAVAYMNIYSLGTIFVQLTLGMNAFITAQGFARTGMLTVSIGAACNLILDPVFIFILGMGVKGAALATIISQFIAALWTFTFLTGKKTIIKIEKDCLIPNFKRTMKIFGLGLSGFTMSITNSAVQMVNNAVLSVWGGDLYIGAMTVINSIREVVHMPVQGISNSSQPIISFNYGAGEPERVKKAIRYMSFALLIYTVSAWILVMLFSKPLILLFNDNPALMNVTVTSMHIYFQGFFMMSFQFAGQSTFTALGRSKQAVFFSLFRKVVIVIPLIYILPHIGNLGVNGVFMAEPVSNFIGGIACFATMYFTVYRKLSTNIVKK